MSKKDKAKKRSARVEAEKARKETDDFIKRFQQEKRIRKDKNSLHR